ncbi:homeobox protein PKNOX1 isoform X1 [Osmerus mordax]|uniref:homeobox protein PKNOX1 isoform X1 n=1 Tax=Osmerus mordax TaxID=8014 RepID=UPI00350F15A4
MAEQLVAMEDYPQVDQILVMGVGEEMEGQEERSVAEERTEGAEGISSSPHTQTPMEADKSNIYRHPLFPLLALMFEKCEQSTQTPECVSSASLRTDLDNFLISHRKESSTANSLDPDTDTLMVGALQVLRIHLLELEKVSDLCKDFCSRYIACLRTKMNSDTLLGAEPDNPDSPGHTQNTSPSSGTLSPQGIMVPASALQHGNFTVATVNPTQMVTAGGTVYQPITVVTPQGQVLAQGLSPGTLRFQKTQLQVQLSQDLSFYPQQQQHEEESSRSKRGVLPKQATNVMRSWLFQHIAHPYPTEEEKKQIAIQTNLSLLQVNNWFINARRRILQPMIDSSSSDTPKSRKRANQSRPTQRFWPDSIATATGLPQAMEEQDDNVAMVTMGVSVEELQSLSSDGATLAMQQVMLGTHSEEEEDDDDEEEEEEGGIAGLG